MKVKMYDKEWEVNNISYGDKRHLWKLSVLAFDEGNVNKSEYYDLLREVEKISGLTEKDYVKKFLRRRNKFSNLFFLKYQL